MNFQPLPEIDIEFQIRTEHRPGFLAKVFAVVGETGALVGDIRTEYVGKTHTIRRITIAVYDLEHAKRLEKAINDFPGAKVLKVQDVVFEKHESGKIKVVRSRDIKNLSDLRYFYTPGVARVCQVIAADPSKAARYTHSSQMVAVVTNGTRVLGLGDIGPLASLPVMEGKAMIYDQFVGISAIPILIDSKDPDEVIETVERIALSFGGIHLEDIRVPDCFYIEEELQRRLNLPVMHDDQHGTATVALAAILSALRATGKKDYAKLRVCQVGLGAAGLGIARLLGEYGFKVVGVDPNADARKRLESLGGTTDELSSAMAASDIVVATTGVVGLIKPEMVRKGQVILALSNPVPEIDPGMALAAGASFAADGKSVNNALAYPGLFKAALNKQCGAITDAMKVAAAYAIAGLTPADELLPSIFLPGLHEAVVKAAEAAVN